MEYCSWSTITVYPWILRFSPLSFAEFSQSMSVVSFPVAHNFFSLGVICLVSSGSFPSFCCAPFWYSLTLLTCTYHFKSFLSYKCWHFFLVSIFLWYFFVLFSTHSRYPETFKGTLTLSQRLFWLIIQFSDRYVDPSRRNLVFFLVLFSSTLFDLFFCCCCFCYYKL